MAIDQTGWNWEDNSYEVDDDSKSHFYQCDLISFSKLKREEKKEAFEKNQLDYAYRGASSDLVHFNDNFKGYCHVCRNEKQDTKDTRTTGVCRCCKLFLHTKCALKHHNPHLVFKQYQPGGSSICSSSAVSAPLPCTYMPTSYGGPYDTPYPLASDIHQLPSLSSTLQSKITLPSLSMSLHTPSTVPSGMYLSGMIHHGPNQNMARGGGGGPSNSEPRFPHTIIH
ncbi:hypothetical protein DFA_01610 [Cavenderia fasciculata]|uniref:Uncharacterized protein n=1 Tax=Cavenderia fasciculata TaxID=261658 RepID=F4PTQ4_CACFS|nr:uncharacterized protein DFA_01610 [Cavenderia fasciculata]EGG21724.1 hypothetical protein DFA_01610 [Cavenderia fasciculata]|eukprot:XP_004359574.1 hypothetical protein DFA_01610 [Cavenderia fasciculata]